jgi:hypothetical protein
MISIHRTLVQPRLPIFRRLTLLIGVSALGGLLFLPFMAAGSHQPIAALISFAAAVTAVGSVAAWLGLRCADTVGLPMPYLRRLDSRVREPVPAGAIHTTVGVGVGAGLLGLVGLRLAHVPTLPGSIVARALSTVFAAGPLEIVLHLELMSVVVWVARGRRWPGIVIAALVLVVFHLSGGGTQQSTAVLAVGVVLNGGIGLVLGWIYAAYGFEFAMGGHAIAHFITLVFG